MLLELLFVTGGIMLDNQNIIKLPNPKYEFIRVFNYGTWTLLSVVSLMYERYYYECFVFITRTVIGCYLYELLFHTPDKSHITHHIITMVTIILGILSNITDHTTLLQLSIIQFVALSSSILSSLRHIDCFRMYKYQIAYFYYFYFIFSKGTAMLLHYCILIRKGVDYRCNELQIITLAFFSSIHIMQMYFIYKIVKKLT